MNSNHNQANDGEAKAKPEVIKLGLDVHARQVTECRQLDASTPKPAQKWNPWKLLNQVEEWVKAGIKVYSCYEASNFSLSDSRRSSFYSSGSSNSNLRLRRTVFRSHTLTKTDLCLSRWLPLQLDQTAKKRCLP